MIYADYNGSSPLIPEVKNYLLKRLNTNLFANPNAIHSLSMRLNRVLEKSRSEIANTLGAHPDQVFFNSGATEGISSILSSLLKRSNKKIIFTSGIEHSAVLEFFKSYKDQFEIKYLPMADGKVLLRESMDLILKDKEKIALVNMMAINNETGVIQPYEEMGSELKKLELPFFSDTTQLIGKIPFNFEDSSLDFAVCSGHKLGALSGSGFMLIKEPTLFTSLIKGHQEQGHRGGTQHYIGIETLAIALTTQVKKISEEARLRRNKLVFESELKKAFPQVVIIGEKEDRLAGTSLIGFRGIHGQVVQIELETKEVFVTTSSACTDNQPETSFVLKAMGIDDDLGRSVIRISLSHDQGEKEYEYLLKTLTSAYNKLLKIKSYV